MSTPDEWIDGLAIRIAGLGAHILEGVKLDLFDKMSGEQRDITSALLASLVQAGAPYMEQEVKSIEYYN